MCCVNSDKAKYEVIIKTPDSEKNVICTVKFVSISTICRFLDEEFDFDYGTVDVFRLTDNYHINVPDLLDVWNTYFVEEF